MFFSGVGNRRVLALYAADYGNEKEVGAALADAFKQGLVKREELFITTKVIFIHLVIECLQSLYSSRTQSILFSKASNVCVGFSCR